MQEEAAALDESAIEESVPEQHEESEQPQFDPEVEQEARMFGWKPPSEWVGEPPARGLVDDPSVFMDNLKKSGPFREAYERLQSMESQYSERFEKLDRFYQTQMERQRQNAEFALKQAQQRQAEAFDSGDKEAWERARQVEDNIRKQMEPPEPQQRELPPEVRSAIDNWRVDNDWFGVDQEKTQAASTYWTEAEKLGLRDPNAILKHVTKRVNEQFAEAPKPVTRKSAPTDEGLAIGGGVEPFSKLPSEAKQAFKKFVKQGLFEDTKEGRATYAEEYNNA